jgi:uncharacterized iron-regulated membrane protein
LRDGSDSTEIREVPLPSLRAGNVRYPTLRTKSPRPPPSACGNHPPDACGEQARASLEARFAYSLIERPQRCFAQLLDPASGEVLGEPELAAAREWIADPHINLLSGEIGLMVNGGGAGCLLLMTFTGP